MLQVICLLFADIIHDKNSTRQIDKIDRQIPAWQQTVLADGSLIPVMRLNGMWLLGGLSSLPLGLHCDSVQFKTTGKTISTFDIQCFLGMVSYIEL